MVLKASAEQTSDHAAKALARTVQHSAEILKNSSTAGKAAGRHLIDEEVLQSAYRSLNIVAEQTGLTRSGINIYDFHKSAAAEYQSQPDLDLVGRSNERYTDESLQDSTSSPSIMSPDSTMQHADENTSSSDESKHLHPLNTIRSAPKDLQDQHGRSFEFDNLPRLKEGEPVPSTRAGRAFGFARLGVGLLFGSARNTFKGSAREGDTVLVNDDNANLLASTLCRMRGAALKLGQMLSIQDESLLPPALSHALAQVRQGADAMPKRQLLQQLSEQFGVNWRDKFESFDESPFAAASIGQVHRARIYENGELVDVVVKVQYPGVARSIESDLRNLSMLITWTGLAPKGLFIENVIRVGTEELKVECDYTQELRNQEIMKSLVEADDFLSQNRFVVPGVYESHSSGQVLTSEYRKGGTIDKVLHLEQEERDRIGTAFMYLTMRELFVWRRLQTDPNWGNFLYDPHTRTTSLIDFGATSEYSKDFVDGYLRIVWASSNMDESTLMEQSHKMKFLTGEENEEMVEAHKQSAYTVGEPFQTNEPFDFRASNISSRMSAHTSVFLKHRLTPPPDEVYTLHRKLAGAYMLCIKLGARVKCRELLEQIALDHGL